MKKITILISILIAFTSCDKDNYIDTGLARGEFDGTVWEYLQSKDAEWNLTAYMIERAGLIDLFDSPDRKITFFAPTNLSIYKYLFEELSEDGEHYYYELAPTEKQMIDLIPVETCKQLILSHVIDGEMKKSDFGFEIKNTLEGGTQVSNLIGKTLRIYRYTSPFEGVPDIAEGLGLHALQSGVITTIASSNIHPNNGYVHSLSYKYKLTILE